MNLAIIGGGPAGLRAAEVASARGASVTLFDAKPSVGRKLLIAGKGGLNLTHSEPMDQFSTRYRGGKSTLFWTTLLSDFNNEDLRLWADGLGIETFIGTSGRVFPKELKAAPLLRRWVERLISQGVQFRMNHRLQTLLKEDDRFILEFKNYTETANHAFDAVILALGGASWPETGSDGKWVTLLNSLGILVEPLSPANCGWEVNWPPELVSEIEGLPLKNITCTAGKTTIAGELLITKYGLEGGALYQLGATLRSMPAPMLILDLKPTFSMQELADKISLHTLDIRDAAAANWKLNKAAFALLRNFIAQDFTVTPLTLAKAAKGLSIPLIAPRPIAEAISSAGGVSFSELEEYLMVKRLPGLFVAGEMVDWEAPTGGYLLQGCFATGTRAGLGAVRYLKTKTPCS